ncbi:PAS domain S-box-containing protein [Azospirillum fermentarium]|uniref:PAS domain-containing protein n=1 Tax=Azospirillum fermentarium TaxID=1233114 RepID=UPI002225E788|nr:PAS domain-containing protein [Azospirillum fermentarium]MCW2247604.1 PAS domain S-box-containing protein [Azospirillum fermentarium]
MTGLPSFPSAGLLLGVLDGTHHGIVVVDAQGRVVLWNRAAHRLLRPVRDPVPGTAFTAALGRPLHPRVEQAVAAALAGRSTLLSAKLNPDCFGLGPRRDGAVPLYAVTTAPVTGGAVTGEEGERCCLLQIIDETEAAARERQLVEHAERLRAGEARFRALADTVPGVLYQWFERTDGTRGFTYVSPRAQEILGVDPEALKNDWTLFRIHPDDVPAWQASIDLSLATGCDWRFEGRMLRPTGEMRWWRGLSRPMRVSAEEIRYNGIILDTTDERRAQDAVRASEERLRLALDAIQDGLWDWHIPSGHILLSDRWETMLGYAPGTVEPHLRSWERLLHPDDAAAAVAGLDEHLAGRTPLYTAEFRLRRADGGWAWVLSRGRLVESGPGGQPLRMVGTHTDIGARKEADMVLAQRTLALQRSNDELEAFAYVASHDLRQPLRVIASYLTLLERSFPHPLEGDARECLDFCQDAARRMDRMIVDLLDYSRAGRGGRPSRPTDLARAVEAAVANLQVAIGETGAVVRVAGALPVLSCDDSEMIRLFQNLIGNALKYRRPGQAPIIIVSATPADGAWTVDVADNGIGIDPEHAERIFGIFQRLHRRTEYDGTGIGLAVCKKIVERHGGRIWVEPAPGGGSVFRFTLAAGGPPAP